jgi:hypothetical protein
MQVVEYQNDFLLAAISHGASWTESIWQQVNEFDTAIIGAA